jgi:hypothetical protein
MTSTEITRTLAKIWKDMSDAEKLPYNDEAKILLNTFKTQNPDYKYSKSLRKRAMKSKRSGSLWSTISEVAIRMVQTEPPKDPMELLTWIGSHVFKKYMETHPVLSDKLVDALSLGSIMAQPTRTDLLTILGKVQNIIQRLDVRPQVDD